MRIPLVIADEIVDSGSIFGEESILLLDEFLTGYMLSRSAVGPIIDLTPAISDLTGSIRDGIPASVALWMYAKNEQAAWQILLDLCRMNRESAIRLEDPSASLENNALYGPEADATAPVLTMVNRQAARSDLFRHSIMNLEWRLEGTRRFYADTGRSAANDFDLDGFHHWVDGRLVGLRSSHWSRTILGHNAMLEAVAYAHFFDLAKRFDPRVTLRTTRSDSPPSGALGEWLVSVQNATDLCPRFPEDHAAREWRDNPLAVRFNSGVQRASILWRCYSECRVHHSLLKALPGLGLTGLALRRFRQQCGSAGSDCPWGSIQKYVSAAGVDSRIQNLA